MAVPMLSKTEPSIEQKFRGRQEVLAGNPALLHTRHRVMLGDARVMEEIADNSIHVVVTSPPYWILKQYDGTAGAAQKV